MGQRIVLDYSDDKDMPEKVLVVKGHCGLDSCFILFYMYRGKPYVVIVPARPSPLCTLLKPSEARIIERILRDLGIQALYLPACKVAAMLLRPSIKDTIDAMISFGLVDYVD
ncbi:hypothetical protein [Pyrofollis japonicus]|uniref:hypothetical protein n=1 Tax=Pyrofollis japonicus TaxID=3060460 RepID=UPI00295AC56E|nr:hypothetical protein [Pyrofollis japonicus]